MEVFSKMKTEGLLRPVLSQTQTKRIYLSYEDTKNHTFRQQERLPSWNDKVQRKLPIALHGSKARFPIKCSNPECGKSRCVYANHKPSNQKVEELKKTIRESNYTCGDQVDVLDTFVVREELDCKEDIEAAYYSALVDGTNNAPLICYACGDNLSTAMLESYIDTKKVWSRVKRTCGPQQCLKHRRKKRITSFPRKADAAWKNQERMAKRLRIQKAR